MNILFIGDIVGNPGMDIVRMWLPSLQKKYKADLVIANGENASDGKGCTEKEAKQLFELGVNVITGGNHTWDKQQSQDYLKKDSRVIRPLNYPRGTHGNGYTIVETHAGKVCVANLQGRAFMSPIDCPFRAAEWLISKVKNEVKIIFIDFHAEATAEKLALANFLDGKVSVIVGTHTHVQTSDERIMKNGTGYITDVGMTGPYDSVIGMKKDAAINRFLFQTPQKYQTATDEVHFSALFAKVDDKTGNTILIERIFIPEFEKSINKIDE
ncbi:MAG: TIGR00282 family metallophosphoesterase [Stygiobacter sp.]|jgi:metallophosphoesterase (TIGR00282 family)|uniref:TIGR00282 family metallophosphoesterase n=1 Tax=Stygiobacter electus TaxID=3032292 RepID=A0AAE3NXG4_9BACT|nr:TIGR00282 family metallophosphoesterase [Stygiobacter electus]MDF1611856.1 TIGR00282 family metallophosphoesterase [Stygiobacter electus]